MKKRLAELVLDDTLQPVSERESYPVAANDAPPARIQAAVLDTRQPAKERSPTSQQTKK